MVLCSEFQHDSLISRIAALHIVHWTTKSQILWFGQLVSHSPSIMESLLGVLPPNDFPEMVFYEARYHTRMGNDIKFARLVAGAPLECCYEGDGSA